MFPSNNFFYVISEILPEISWKIHLNSIEADNLLIREENMHIINYDANTEWIHGCTTKNVLWLLCLDRLCGLNDWFNYLTELKVFPNIKIIVLVHCVCALWVRCKSFNMSGTGFPSCSLFVIISLLMLCVRLSLQLQGMEHYWPFREDTTAAQLSGWRRVLVRVRPSHVE